jgi:hypothetical protein
VKVTEVGWMRDVHGKQALELKLDGHPMHIRSSQKTGLIERGILEGVVFLDSELASQLPNPYIQGDHAPAYTPRDLVGCTDDAGVFALYQVMCEAIRTDRWSVGGQPVAQ